MASWNRTDRDWQEWGEKNPYFGVFSDPKFLNANLNEDSLAEFFASGERHVDHVFEVIRKSVSPAFTSNRVLDYGCGIGRLVLPFAARSHSVVGVDVSPGMLAQAQENCKKLGISSACFLQVHEMDALEPASFDLVHSFIVFQHIPVTRGEQILRRLIALLSEGGVGAIHFSYCDTRPVLWAYAKALRQRVSFVHRMFNMAQGRPFSTPVMQMNSYSINRLFDILLDANCSNVHVEFSVHGVHRGTMIYFQKSPARLL